MFFLSSFLDIVDVLEKERMGLEREEGEGWADVRARERKDWRRGDMIERREVCGDIVAGWRAGLDEVEVGDVEVDDGWSSILFLGPGLNAPVAPDSLHNALGKLGAFQRRRGI